MEYPLSVRISSAASRSVTVSSAIWMAVSSATLLVALPNWASGRLEAADVPQLEQWSEDLLNAQSLDALLC